MKELEHVKEGDSMASVLEKMRQMDLLANAFMNARPGVGDSNAIIISDSNVVFQLKRVHAV